MRRRSVHAGCVTPRQTREQPSYHGPGDMFPFAPKQPKHQHPRNKFFVSREIQGRLTLRLAIYWFIYHVALWHALFAFRYIEQRLSGQLVGKPFRELYGDFVLQYYPLILCAVAMVPVFFFDLIRLTHRVAGPLVQFRHRLNDMIAGAECRRVRLRKGDLLTELEASFNEYIDVYERRRLARLAQATMAEHDADLLQATVENHDEPSVDSPLPTAEVAEATV
ncbi:MAG: hypothetical protein R3B90_12795 [Planctomycetaceae bacterium]